MTSNQKPRAESRKSETGRKKGRAQVVASEATLAIIPKNAHERIVVRDSHIGERHGIDLRIQFLGQDDEWHFCRRGVWVPIDSLPELAAAVAAAAEKAA